MLVPNSVTTKRETTDKLIGRERIALFNRTKNFRKGEIVVHPFDYREFSGTSTSDDVKLKYLIYGVPQVVTSLSGDIAAKNAVPSKTMTSVYSSDLLDNAGRRAISKMGEPAVDYGMILAEAGETLSMIINPIRSIPKLFSKLKRPRAFRRGKRIPKAFRYASDKWMEYRYGIAPTLRDIEDVRTKTTKVLGRHVPVQKKSSYTSLDSSNSQRSLIGSTYGYYTKLEEATKVSAYATAHIYFRVNDAIMHNLNLKGLNPLSLPLIAYESVPLSFVLDWFVDVGGWLQAMRPKPEYTALGLSSSITHEATYAMAATELSCYSNFQYSSACSSYYFAKVRRTFRGADIPVTPRYPSVNANLLKFSQHVDLSILSWQRSQGVISKLRGK